ncbi:hypothetical protein EXU57_15300 [Segetibacter sp. 3557_3]|uniref:hypothetical protein n=1 Tax=Segetibacter sp. 3557_3 TaxID=2547429 RepID=UPI001058B1A8|nr:hypothetical protein [Segetibacter sp. 3557_3]TDH24179.1 hypothetical protein EXU57_15300 [Segetibacter sp. 3557_3]
MPYSPTYPVDLIDDILEGASLEELDQICGVIKLEAKLYQKDELEEILSTIFQKKIFLTFCAN